MEAELFKTAQPVQKVPFGTGELIWLGFWSIADIQIQRQYGNSEGQSDRMLTFRYFVYTSRMGIVRRVSYNPPAPEDQLTIRKQV